MRLNHSIEQRTAQRADAHANVGDDHGADEQPRNSGQGSEQAASDEDDDGGAGQEQISADGIKAESFAQNRG